MCIRDRASTAPASGCSLGFSRLAAKCSNVVSSTPCAGRRSVTTGLPFVRVPVLSSTTAFTEWAVSSASPDLIRMPFSAPLPVPTIIATEMCIRDSR